MTNELSIMLGTARTEWHRLASGHNGQDRWTTEVTVKQVIDGHEIELHIGRPRVTHTGRAKYSSGPERWKKNGVAIKFADLS